jgi:Flp pilus assembly pilin Flp
MSNMFFAIQLVIEAIRATLNRNFAIKSQNGAINIEYALLGVLIAVVMAGVLNTIGQLTKQMYVSIGSAFP